MDRLRGLASPTAGCTESENGQGLEHPSPFPRLLFCFPCGGKQERLGLIPVEILNSQPSLLNFFFVSKTEFGANSLGQAVH